MSRPRIRTTAPSSDRSAEIEAVVESVARERLAGQAIDDESVQRRHPHLMPELGEALRTLRSIEAAREAGKEAQAMVMNGDDATSDRDIEILSKVLRDYRILERLHSGGQGVVYKAVHVVTGRFVAVKVLLHGPFASERQRHRFWREVELASRMRHPNIVTLYEAGTVEGRPFCIMEFVDGFPIDDYAELHGLETRAVARMFVMVCRAASYAHQRGVIHRDLKPTNILVDSDGEPHILDFGLAKDLTTEQEASLSIEGQVLGTLPYLSPEQARGAVDDVDVRSDVYALGVVLYKLLTDSLPYVFDGDRAALRNRIVSDEPLSLRRASRLACFEDAPAASGIDADLEAVVSKALSKDRSARYQSAEALAADLERFLRGEAVEARAGHRLYQIRKTLRRYRVHAAVAISFLLVVTASAVVATALWLQTRTERDRAQQVARLAHATLDDVVTEFDEAVRPLVGGTAVRDRVFRRVGERLAELTPLAAADVTMEDVLGATYEKQGDIAVAQGAYKEAAQHYGAFLDVSRRLVDEDPRNPRHRASLARAYRKLGQVSDDFDGLFGRAIETAERVAADGPRDSAALYELCDARVAFATRLFAAGFYERAAAQIDAALIDGARFDEDDEWRRLLAAAHSVRGRACIELGDAEAGIKSLEKSLDYLQKLSDANPSDAELRCKMLALSVHLGDLHRDSGKPDQAKELYQTAISIGDYLVRADPTVATWQRELYGARYRLAQLLLLTSHDPEQIDEAQSECDEAVRLAEGLIKTERDNEEWQHTLAFSHRLRGMVRQAQSAWEPAVEDFDQAAGILESLVAAETGTPRLRSELAGTYDQIGICCAKLRRLAESLDYYIRARDIRRVLFDEQPTVVKHALDLIASDVNLATCYIWRDTPEDDARAKELLDKARSWLGELHDGGQLEGAEERYETFLDSIQRNLRILSKRGRIEPDSSDPE